MRADDPHQYGMGWTSIGVFFFANEQGPYYRVRVQRASSVNVRDEDWYDISDATPAESLILLATVVARIAGLIGSAWREYYLAGFEDDGQLLPAQLAEWGFGVASPLEE